MTVVVTFLRRLKRLFLNVRASLHRRNPRKGGIAEACASLPEPARSIYLLSARDGLSFERIATCLELPVATVERELANALFLLGGDDIAVASGSVDG